MKAFVKRFAKDTSGATAIEYGLIAGMVSVVIITALTLIGPQLASIFGQIATALTGAAT
jgi:pilus assembly protein Flp/PilA